jgi:hypothetical protein
METYFITVYVIVEEVIRILKIKDDPQSIMSNAEVMTFVIITTKIFLGNFKMARYTQIQFLSSLGYMRMEHTIVLNLKIFLMKKEFNLSLKEALKPKIV